MMPNPAKYAGLETVGGTYDFWLWVWISKKVKMKSFLVPGALVVKGLLFERLIRDILEQHKTGCQHKMGQAWA